MYLVNPMEMAKILRDRWISQYGSKGPAEARLARLLTDLGANPTPGQVNQTFANHYPNRGHTNRVDVGPYICDECGSNNSQVVRMGKEVDWEQGPSNICAECLYAAIRLMDGE